MSVAISASEKAIVFDVPSVTCLDAVRQAVREDPGAVGAIDTNRSSCPMLAK